MSPIVPLLFIALYYLHRAGNAAQKRTNRYNRDCILLQHNYFLIDRCIHSATTTEHLQVCADMINQRISPYSKILVAGLYEYIQTKDREIEGNEIVNNVLRYPETEEA